MSGSVLVARPVWPVMRRLGEDLSSLGYSVAYAGSWSILLEGNAAGPELAAAILGEYGDVVEEEGILRRFRALGDAPGPPVLLVGGRNAANRAGRFREAGADLVFTADMPAEEILREARPLISWAERYRAVAAANRELREQAATDALTGLPNRKHFVRELGRCVEMVRRIGRPLSCILSDIDDLKTVNASHGRPAGDAVIRHFADTLSKAKRRYDVVARLGGDKFAWLLVNADPAQAMKAARRARRLAAESVIEGTDPPVRVTSAWGVATITPGHGWTPESLLEDADRALRWAKESGKDAARFYPPGKGAGDA